MSQPTLSGPRLAVLIAGNFFVATSFMSVTGLLNEIADSLRISIAQAGLLIAAFALTAAFCAPVLATAGSRIDRRKLLTLSIAICALANLLAALSETYAQLMAARVLAAVTSAVYTPQVAATVSMIVSERDRGPAMAKLMTGWAIGSVAGSPLVVLIGTTFGWRVSMAAIAAASGVVALLVWRVVPSGVKVPPLNWQRWIQVFRSPSLTLLTATTGLNAVGNTIVFSYIAPIMAALHGVAGSVLAALYFVNGLGGLAGNIAGVQLIRRVGAARIASAAGIMIGVTFVLWPLIAGSLVLIFILQALWSWGAGSFPAAQQTRLVMVAPHFAAATIALNSSVGYLGASVGTTLGASAWTLAGPRYMAWCGLAFILASIWCSHLSERVQARRAAPE
jgi:predicted MFS family arabinose efflux permease